MKQYCRYCSHCYYGDIVWCDAKEKEIRESTAKHTNTCKEFEFCEMDVFCENPNPYAERKHFSKTKKTACDSEQLSIFGEVEK